MQIGLPQSTATPPNFVRANERSDRSAARSLGAVSFILASPLFICRESMVSGARGPSGGAVREPSRRKGWRGGGG